MPQIKKAKGGPPTEEWNEGDCESEGDLNTKDVDIQRFNDNWARYLKGEVWTKTRLYDVAIFERDEEDDENRYGDDEEEGDEEDDEEVEQESEENDKNDEGVSDDAAKAASTAGEGESSNKRAAAEDLIAEDPIKRARYE